MFNALFYKEWIKTRRIVLLIGLIFAGIIVYSFIHTAQSFRVGGPVQVWADIILKDAPVLPPFIQWLPVMTALLLGFTQFVPEMSNKKLKLSLHLPLSETRIVTSMLCYGLLVLTASYVVTYVVIMTGLSHYFPTEIRMAALWKSLPWFIAGLAAYPLAVWICIEPVWRQKIFNALITLCILALFFITAPSGAYLPVMPVLLIVAVICFGLPFFSTARFKEGKQ